MKLPTGVVRKVLESFIGAFRAWFSDMMCVMNGVFCLWYPDTHNASRLLGPPEAV
jgi:hypothetical protein